MRHKARLRWLYRRKANTQMCTGLHAPGPGPGKVKASQAQLVCVCGKVWGGQGEVKKGSKKVGHGWARRRHDPALGQDPNPCPQPRQPQLVRLQLHH